MLEPIGTGVATGFDGRCGRLSWFWYQASVCPRAKVLGVRSDVLRWPVAHVEVDARLDLIQVVANVVNRAYEPRRQVEDEPSRVPGPSALPSLLSFWTLSRGRRKTRPHCCGTGPVED